MKITASERMRLRPLGPDVLRCAERLAAAIEDDGRTGSLWRDLLEMLHRQHADLMETPLGVLFTVAVLGRITKANKGAGHPPSGLGRRG